MKGIRRQRGESDASYAIRLAAHNAHLQNEIDRLVQRIANWPEIGDALGAWARRAPLDGEHLEEVVKAHGWIRGRRRDC